MTVKRVRSIKSAQRGKEKKKELRTKLVGPRDSGKVRIVREEALCGSGVTVRHKCHEYLWTREKLSL
ncbi:Hypothetical protein SMAX5B_001123 [Scophthalmus maximus]|uniref:Uncharacterized protein n=1 Tax=Scophthalmus maximus TaxID=52904 RepID=A0A2U9CCW6_SCOMX|nr:Hypothetical protein SMAX5B_001123 [Scophthalmus maximus]